MWVFGYGSLIWKVDFPYEEKLVGYIEGYVRRFYQKSTDHRGTPDKAGRVVTLIESKNSKDQVWGLAYKIAPENIEHVTNHLDYREKGGYTRRTVLFYPRDPSSSDPTDSPVKPFDLTIYIGGEDNPNFAGGESIDVIAKHITEAKGPSGDNTEYLYKLAAAMRTVAPGITDWHLFRLEETVRKLEEERIAATTTIPVAATKDHDQGGA